MATPLHHDRPQQNLRLLQDLKNNPKKHAENSMNSDGVAWKFAFPQTSNSPAVQPPLPESPTNPWDSQPRRGAQQLPPRPPLSPSQMHHRQHLRHRHQAEPIGSDRLVEVRSLEQPRLSSPVASHAVSSLQGPGLDRPHARRSLEGQKPINSDYSHIVNSVEGACEHPHVPSLSEVRARHAKDKEQLTLQQWPDGLRHGSTGNEHPASHSHQQKQVLNEWGLCSPHAYLVDAQNIGEAEMHQPTQKLASSSTTNSHTRDYKAALTQNISHEQSNSQQSPGQFYEQPDAKENYFECKQDGKRQGQGQSSRLDYPSQAGKNQQHCLDFSKMQYISAEECPDVNNCDYSALRPLKSHMEQHANMSKQHHQKQSQFHLVVPSFGKCTHRDEIGDEAAVDHEASANINPHSESGIMTSPENHDSISPQRIHEYQFELSEASPDDSYFHVSKELVEQDYQNECHLATSSTNHQGCGHVYDYSRAGVTLVENNLKLVDEPELEKDPCSTSQEREEDCSYCEQVDSQNHPGILEHQLQDVESPPLFLGFNQNSTRFACGTSKGFRVYDIGTMSECFSSMVGGVGLIELLLQTNTFLLVGGGPNPSFPLNKVVLWDGLKGESCGERSQKYPVLAVKVRQDRLVVVVENEVLVYNYSNAKLLFQAITMSNPRGLCAISVSEGPSVLACPGLKKGEVRIEHIGTSRGREELPTRSSLVISAHDSGLACMALTLDGSLLATASDRGTLIRVFNTHAGTPFKEVRRGMDRAEIFSIAFSFSSDWLAVSSDKGTIHVFGLRVTGLNTTETNHATSTVRNVGSSLSFIKGVLPRYFSSEWSAAQFKLSEEMKSVVAFSQEKHIIFILGTDGSFYKCSFDPEHGGDMKQLEYVNFMKPREATT